MPSRYHESPASAAAVLHNGVFTTCTQRAQLAAGDANPDTFDWVPTRDYMSDFM